MKSWPAAARTGNVMDNAGVAEWLGTGLQSRLYGFDSRHSLHVRRCSEVHRVKLGYR